MTRTRRSSGNIFTDLGFDAPEAANLALRSTLMVELTRRLNTLGMTQVQAARTLGITQSRVSDLVRGKIDRFSVDTLVKLLGMAGVEVKLSVRVKPRAA